KARKGAKMSSRDDRSVDIFSFMKSPLRMSLLWKLGVVGVLALAPAALLLALTYGHALDSARADLEEKTQVAAERVNRLLKAADLKLTALVRDALDLPPADLQKHLIRIVYDDPRFREAGVVDEQGRLVLSNFREVDPPIPLPPEKRCDPHRPGLQ